MTSKEPRDLDIKRTCIARVASKLRQHQQAVRGASRPMGQLSATGRGQGHRVHGVDGESDRLARKCVAVAGGAEPCLCGADPQPTQSREVQRYVQRDVCLWGRRGVQRPNHWILKLLSDRQCCARRAGVGARQAHSRCAVHCRSNCGSSCHWSLRVHAVHGEQCQGDPQRRADRAMSRWRSERGA